jgi:hypothetical protein
MNHPDGPRSPDFSRVAALTQDFYAWEKRGRGWQVWPEPVELEPPFRPFSLRRSQPTCTPVDDGRRATLFSRVLDRFFQRSRDTNLESNVETEEPDPDPAFPIQEIVEIQLALPKDSKVTLHHAEAFLLSLSACRSPIAFEAIGTESEIILQFACSIGDRPSLLHQLQAAFPEVVLRETSGSLVDHLEPVAGTHQASVDFGLNSECMCPLRVPEKWSDADPFGSLAAALSALEHEEKAAFQVIFTPARAPWASNLVRAVTTWEGNSFFIDAPQMVKQAEEKVARPLYAVVIRAAAISGSEHRAQHILRGVVGALAHFTDPASNALIPLDDEDYSSDERVRHMAQRVSRRIGMLLNVTELAALAHPPSASVSVPRLRRDDGRTRLAPATLQGHQYVLGESRHLGETRVVSLPPEIRRRHMHVIGATGTGKSTLLLNLIVQDMENGNGLAVFDPHGDLIDDILQRVPESRMKDVVLIDPSDTEYVVGVNVLHAHSDLEKTLIASDMVAVFKRLSTAWGDQMTAVLGNAVLAILESDRGGTLVDLRRFLIDKEFRNGFLPSVRDEEVREYWQAEYPLLTGRPHASVLARLGSFLRPKPIRAMVSAREKTLDLSAVMGEGRIFLAKLSQGLIGEENSALLGAMFVGKFQQLALARQAHEAQTRRPFTIYLDEFQNFATPTLTTLLSGGRKYGVGLVLAHQEMRQVATHNPDLLSAVLANAATRVAFRVGDDDAKRLEDGFENFKARDLQNLGVGEAIVRVEKADMDFSIATRREPPLGPDAVFVRACAIEASRERYGQLIPVSAETGTPPEVVLALEETCQPSPQAPQEPQQPVERRQSAPARPATPPPPTPGRGGARHKYLQELIKRWGEANNWRVIVEKAVLDGLGSVDVALERDGISVACEIGASSPNQHELQNIQKCLAAGFQFVVAVILDAKRSKQMTAAVTAELGEDASRVVVTTPDGLFEILTRFQTDAAPEAQSVRGYQVKVRKGPSGHGAGTSGAQRAAQVIVEALTRLARR